MESDRWHYWACHVVLQYCGVGKCEVYVIYCLNNKIVAMMDLDEKGMDPQEHEETVRYVL
jgi:hypothetical protein